MSNFDLPELSTIQERIRLLILQTENMIKKNKVYEGEIRKILQVKGNCCPFPYCFYSDDRTDNLLFHIDFNHYGKRNLK